MICGKVMNVFSGILAASSWMLLGAITAFGLTLGEPINVTINLAMAATFGLVGAFLLWRTRALARLHRTHADDRAVATLLRAQLVADLAMGLLGSALATAAALRIWREALPVFG